MELSARRAWPLVRLVVPLAAALTLLIWPSAATPVVEAWRAKVAMGDNFFHPATLHIRPGDTVVWDHGGRHAHTVTSSFGRFDSGILRPRQDFALTFGHPGTYASYCRIHPEEMPGIVVVGRDPGTYRYRSCAPFYGYPGYGLGIC